MRWRARATALVACAALGAGASACEAPATGLSSVVALTLRPEVATVLLGDTLAFQLTAEGPAGPVPEPGPASWSADDPEIAAVDGLGRARALRAGWTRITARLAGRRAVATLIAAPPVLVGAGDIAACDSPGDEQTAALLDRIPGTVFTLGDHAYPHGRASDFRRCYDPGWGRHRGRTRPAPGNHDYDAGGAAYFAYFGAHAGRPDAGYYSYDVGGWHIVVLDSNRDLRPGSAQESWLRADLAAHPARCTLAYWHHPQFSSGPHDHTHDLRPAWEALHDAGAELILNGHDHLYERFAPQTPDGEPDAERGIRQLTVGTGGAPLHGIARRARNSEVVRTDTWGVLEIALHDDGYEWQFVPAAGSFRDSGHGRCHG